MSPAPAIRLALIVCDTPPPPIVRADGDYPHIFTTLLRASLPDGVTDFVLDTYDVKDKMEYPSDEALDTYRGIIITGSAASAYEDIPWINKLVEWLARVADSKPQLKIIGICFGHQVIARALGGSCVRNSEWEISVTELGLNDLGQRIFGTKTLNIQQMHRDHVPTVPPSFHLLGSTTVTPVQAMVRFAGPPSPPSADEPLPPIQILTVQGHPEFTKEIVDKLVDVRSASGLFDQAMAEDAKRRGSWRNDGVPVVGKAIWEVLKT
ncbi:hypothetical protein EWM64_g3151 [Hericium alpestre]|uniref:Glutamine amidotransferase domain-containing protein n=1 Tax=Hericium alpestre TaxID=135208 RepID=A0A4Z0A321_9AGAM|nr:hypothetical protein EWM64_g3151 [Hericium alpestre]